MDVLSLRTWARNEDRGDDDLRELLLGQNRGPAADPSSTVQPAVNTTWDYIYATNPGTDLEVIFAPGETIPAWAVPE